MFFCESRFVLEKVHGTCNTKMLLNQVHSVKLQLIGNIMIHSFGKENVLFYLLQNHNVPLL